MKSASAGGLRFFLVVLGVIATSASAWPDSQGPLFPVTVVNDAGSGTHAWTPPGEAAADDNVLASSSFASGASTQLLDASDFSFAIPDGAIIDGIQVHVDGLYLTSPTSPEWSVQTVKGGTPSPGTRMAAITGGLETAILGHSSDLWGDAWTPADVNSSTFGVQVQAVQSGSLSGVGVDDISITVHFSPDVKLSDMGGGDWASAGTWTFGVPPTADEIAFITESHPVTVTTAANCWNLLVSDNVTVDASGSLNVAVTPDTDADPLDVGFSAPAIVTNSGILNVFGHDVHLGLGTRFGQLVCLDNSSTLVTDGDVHVGFSGPGDLTVEGQHAFSTNQTLHVGQTSGGSITIRPIDSGGGAALNAIQCADLNLGSSSTIVLDTTGYTPQIGDIWGAISFTGSVTGEFSLVASTGPLPPNSEVVVSATKAGGINIAIVASSSMPSVMKWGLVLLITAIVASGTGAVWHFSRVHPIPTQS